MKMAGIVFIVLGVLGLIYQGFSYTAPHKDLQIGSLEVQHNESHFVWMPPVVSGALLLGGILALAVSSRKRY